MTAARQHRHEIRPGPRDEDLARCVHCGFCLQACPTYVISSLETESPRGRIQLARALAEGRIQATANVAQHFDLCLQCRACETACPSGVPYGRIIEGARALIQARPDRPPAWRSRTLALRVLFARPWRLRLVFSALRIYQRTPLPPLVRRLLPRRLREMEEMLPKLSRPFFEPPPSAAEPAGPARATAALLAGCVMPMTHPGTQEATVRVLTRNGYRVLVPPGQGCCGALHLHNGDPDAARSLARRNIDEFLASGADYVAVNAAGCGSAMKEYPDLFAHDAAWREKAGLFAARVRDVTELLAEGGFEPPRGRLPLRVTYQDSCHLAHAQRIREAPRALLRSIPGLRLVEMAAPDRCCGSAGIYNLTQTEMSRRVLAGKMDDVMTTDYEAVCTANPGCMLQLELGVRLWGGSQEVVHVVDLLDRAYAAEGRDRPGG